MDVRLIMFKESGESKEFPLEPGKTVIGRKEECDLRIPLPEVSRRHAVVIVSGQTVTLRDMGSANGTYLNNSRITEEELSPGDHVVIGPVVFTVRIDGHPTDVRPVHTRLEARSPGTAEPIVDQKPTEAKAAKAADDDIFNQEEDPISALEALAASDDTAALDLDDSFGESEETSP